MKLSTGVRSIFSTLIFIGLVLGMQACGGRGGSTPTPTDANPTGYYDNTGTITVDDDGEGGGNTVINDLQAMINGNRFMMISDAQGLFYDGTITSISTNDFAANVSVYKHGQLITPTPAATISGTITEGSKIEGTLTGAGAGNSNGMFTLQYAANNNQASNLSRIENTSFGWRSNIAEGADTTKFEVFSGTITNGVGSADGFFISCNISSGSFTPISGTSLYTVTMNVTGCTPNTAASTTYTGLAATWTSTNADDRAVIGVTNDSTTLSINGDFN